MEQSHIPVIAEELKLNAAQVRATADLLAEGGTIPFIARYRKEATGSLDEVAVTAIRDRLVQLEELDQRKAAVLKSLEQNGHLTEELKEKVTAAPALAVLEDIYLPFRPKRRTRATIAREKGLEPLALAIMDQKGIDPDAAAAPFLDAEKGVESIEDALAGARDIIAEIVNEDSEARARMRSLFQEKGVIRSRVAKDKEAEGQKFKDYFEWEEPVATAPSHRILAMRRGEEQDVLNVDILPPEDAALALLDDIFVQGEGPGALQVQTAVRDAYKRLLSRSMETEVRLAVKKRADEEAIGIFAQNLRELLLAPPLGRKRVMAVDPGFRTGCKVVCLDAQGKLLHHDLIHPHFSDGGKADASRKVLDLCQRFEVEAVAVGNGTAGRETEAFIRTLPLPEEVVVVLVNESGASVYSASEAAREEFPDLDLTVRGAVSIGRRLMDPLAELVKIDPKAIGVGQYQHDVDQAALRQALDDVVISCVNAVGVDVNTASAQLLTYVSGLGPVLARNIVSWRNEKGPFRSREELKEVPRLGPKAFEQCAGFLRIHGGRHPLDASAVHPESYPIVERMAASLDATVEDLIKSAALRGKIDLVRYVTDTVGLPTLEDILKELDKPGRDPRQDFEPFAFARDINQMEDLVAGMRVPGIVTNVTAFGAFVDIGVHQDGLVHISEMADRYVKDPARIVKVQDRVKVTVLSVDLERRRISLSMKSGGGREKPAEPVVPKKGEPGRRGRKPAGPGKGKPGGSSPQPFNNPFADLLKPGGRR